MGKRGRPGRTGGSGQANFDKILATVPSEAQFEITMDDHSATEVYEDIDTNLQDGEAWLVYGCEWMFEAVDPTIPLATDFYAVVTGTALTLQVHRNDDSEILLNFNDDDLMYQDTLDWQSAFNTEGWGVDLVNWPRFFGRRTITFSEKLRVLFRTQDDVPAISTSDVQIAGRLLYDRIKAPSIGQSKLGQIANL